MASERQEHTTVSPWWGEHVHRYDAAAAYIRGSDAVMLDIACGNGFGTALLAEHTSRTVTGGDISEEAIAACRDYYKTNGKVDFRVMDATQLPFSDGHFDLLVSFETIEHTTAYREMAAELARVLAQNGTLVISTPNILVNSPTGIVTNPYHTQEFTYEELKDILEAQFGNVIIYGQRYIRYKNSSLRARLAAAAEKILYIRGVRKLPLSIQNGIMRLLGEKGMYPLRTEYEMTADKNELLKCKTFFAVCRKQ